MVTPKAPSELIHAAFTALQHAICEVADARYASDMPLTCSEALGVIQRRLDDMAGQLEQVELTARSLESYRP